MIKISASKIKTFSSCERQFFYRYIDRVPTGVGGRALLGRCVHKAIELGFQGRDPFEVYNEEWMRGVKEVTGTDNMQKLYNEGLKMLDIYDFDQIPPVEMELGFELPFPNRDNPAVLIQGYIDQIFPGGVLVDMKTSVKRPQISALKYSPQFVLYAWAFRELYGKLPKVYWHHLRTGEKFLADVQEDQIKSIIPIVKGLEAQIKYADEIEQYHRNVGFECSFCPFSDICLGD